MRVDNLLVASVERDALELFADALDLVLRTSDRHLVRIAKLDMHELVLANDRVQGRATLTNHGAVQSGRDLDGRGGQVGKLARERFERGLDLVERGLGFRTGKVLASVDEEDVAAARLGRREHDVDRVVLLVLADLGPFAADQVPVHERVDLDRLKHRGRQPPHLANDGLTRLRDTLRTGPFLGRRADNLEVRVGQSRDGVETREVDLRAGSERDRAQSGPDDQVPREVGRVLARVVRPTVGGEQVERFDRGGRGEVHDLSLTQSPSQ